MKAIDESRPISLLDLSEGELHESLTRECRSDVPRFRATQICEWIYRHQVTRFEEMANVPAALRKTLARRYAIVQSETVTEQRSTDGTHKLLLRWRSGGTTECVFIPSEDRVTACISTQVGCPVKCTFCASGLGGLERNLSVGEIVEQAWRIAGLCASLGRRLSNVVFMGLGEPLANYNATVGALRTINASWGLAIGARRITISTVGLPGQMRRLADEDLQITLAVSLHAPTDELRRELSPWADRVSIDELIDACRYYFDRTGREVTLEYILLDGVNNLPRHAEQLASLSKRMRSNVNLICYNEVAEMAFKRPTDESVARFAAVLSERGANCNVRRSRGRDIDAACGQLRRKTSEPC